VVEAVRHGRTVLGEIRRLQNLPEEELMAFAKEIGAPYELVKETRELGRLPVVNFAAGGIATPADAALMMQLGVDGVFVGSGIFKSGDRPNERKPSSKPRHISGMPAPGRSQPKPGRSDGRAAKSPAPVGELIAARVGNCVIQKCC